MACILPRGMDKLPDTHPLCRLIPAASDAEIKAITESIREHGLIEDVVLYEGAILDGRTRITGCNWSNTAVRFREFGSLPGDGSDPVAFVIAKNLRRRHLSESQIAMAAARLVEAHRESALARQLAGTLAPRDAKGKATERAAEAAGVSPRTVERAVKVARDGTPELQHAVETDRIPVARAALLAELPTEEQVQVVALTPEQILAEARRIKMEKKTPDAKGSVEQYTPEKIIEFARVVLGEIDLDPASCREANEVVRAKKYLTQKQNGLAHRWLGKVWLNCPYGTDEGAESRQAKWNAKLVADHELGFVTAALTIVNASTGDQWFDAIAAKYPVCFTPRMAFRLPKEEVERINAERVAAGKKPRAKVNAQPKTGSAIFYMGPDPLLFAREAQRRSIGRVRFPPAMLGDLIVEEVSRRIVAGGLALHEAWAELKEEMGWLGAT